MQTTTTTPANPAGDVLAARRTVAAASRDSADCAAILGALGIGAGWTAPAPVPAQSGREAIVRRYPDPAMHATRVGKFV